MFFKNIAGQQNIKDRLTDTFRKQRVPHAMLFNGPVGNGKVALAIAFARMLLCKTPVDNDACGNCSSCHKIDKLEHPDLHFIFPVIAKSTLRVSDDYIKEWRSYVLESPYISINGWMDQLDAENKQPLIYTEESKYIVKKAIAKSYEGSYKCMIIYFPERMHAHCSNKLLKLIEEPPEKTVFFLISENMEQLLPTIISRCQIVNVPRIADEDLKQVFSETIPDEHKLNEVVRLAGGNLIRANEIINQSEWDAKNLEFFINLMRLAWKRDIISLKSWSDEIAAIGRERQKGFLQTCQRMVRENFILNLGNENLNYMSSAEADFSKKFSPFINEKNVIKIYEELDLAQRHIEQNVNAKMVFFDICLKMIMLLKS